MEVVVVVVAAFLKSSPVGGANTAAVRLLQQLMTLRQTDTHECLCVPPLQELRSKLGFAVQKVGELVAVKKEAEAGGWGRRRGRMHASGGCNLRRLCGSEGGGVMGSSREGLR